MNRDEIRAALTGPSGSIRTPFHRDGSVDFKGLANVIEANITGGSRTVLLTAGDSHYLCLSDQEIAEITKFTIKQVRGRAMVCAADRYYDTNRAVEFAKFARGAGADLCMVMPPDWGHSMTPETLVEHYAAVAKHMPVMVVTNIFIPRGAAFGMAALKLCLQKVKGIVAVKDDFCGDFGRKMALLVSDHWAVWSGGLKQNHLDIHPYGCDGYLSTLVTFRPKVAHDYWQAIQKADLSKARAVIRDVEIPWFDHISKLPGGFDAGIHGMLELYGIAKRWRRKPYYSLSDAEMGTLRACVKKLGLL
jgi:4-hydroxy-tetrahydrodipicolinate synthase